MKHLLLNDACYKNNKEEIILGITIENKLNFDSHIRNMCKNSGQKLNALSRILLFLNKDQKRSILNVMMKSQFSYSLNLNFFVHNNLTIRQTKSS